MSNFEPKIVYGNEHCISKIVNSNDLPSGQYMAMLKAVEYAVNAKGQAYILFAYRVMEGEGIGKIIHHYSFLSYAALRSTTATLDKLAPGVRHPLELQNITTSLIGLTATLAVRSGGKYLDVELLQVTHPPQSFCPACKASLKTTLSAQGVTNAD